MSVLWGPRPPGPDLINSLIIEVVSVSAPKQIGTHDQNHAQQHVSGKASNTGPAHVGNKVPVDGHGRREVRTVAENKVPVVKESTSDAVQGLAGRCPQGRATAVGSRVPLLLIMLSAGESSPTGSDTTVSGEPWQRLKGSCMQRTCHGVL